MPIEGCAFVCGIFSVICAVLSGYAMKTGDVSAMIVTVVCAAIVVLIASFVLVMRYVR